MSARSGDAVMSIFSPILNNSGTTRAPEDVRRAHLAAMLLHLAVRFRGLEIEPAVRVQELELRQLGVRKRHRLAQVGTCPTRGGRMRGPRSRWLRHTTRSRACLYSWCSAPLNSAPQARLGTLAPWHSRHPRHPLAGHKIPYERPAIDLYDSTTFRCRTGVPAGRCPAAD
jgi:hypothetical protein